MSRTRAMVNMIAIGEAAGTAGAMCGQTKVVPRKLDVARLQDVLVKQGVELRRNRGRIYGEQLRYT